MTFNGDSDAGGDVNSATADASMPVATGEVRTVRCCAFPCDQVKRESNNWFIVWSDDPAGMFHCVGYTEAMFELVGDQARVACGPACAQKLIEKFLSGRVI